MFVIASADSEALDRWREWLGAQASVVEVRRFEALAECLLRLQPRLLLLDLRLLRPGMLRDVGQLLKVCPNARMIALAADCSEDLEIALFRAGARGICGPDVPREMLLKVVAAVLGGELWIRRVLVPRLLDSVAAEATNAATGSTGRFAMLTPREVEITRLIAKGENNKHIARYLAITERTVKNHLSAIFRKIGVVDRLKLAVLAVRRR
jgi:DNA-binding NarL/FixJ family response regulator